LKLLDEAARSRRSGIGDKEFLRIYLWPDSPQNVRADLLFENQEDRFAGDRAIADFESEPSQPRSQIGQHLCICRRCSLDLLFGEATAEGCSILSSITWLSVLNSRWESRQCGGRKSGPTARSGAARRKVLRSSWPSAHARPILRDLQPSVRRAGLQPTVVWGRTALRSDAAIGRVRHA
jgi:hypothetical protein